MTAHEAMVPGPAAAVAVALSAHLPVLETPRLGLRAPALADFEHWAEIYLGPSAPFLGGPFTRDDAFVDFMASVGNWPPVAPSAVSPRAETEGRRIQDVEERP
jgi:RimJ/RimL family protein N-acetyltransferase